VASQSGPRRLPLKPSLEGCGGSPSAALLFLASFAALYFEMVLIRYLSTEVRDFAYLKNLPLIASFLGLGAGMIIQKPLTRLKRLFPYLTAFLFAVISFAPQLHLTHIAFPGSGDFVWAETPAGLPPSVGVLIYLGVMLGLTAVVVAFFIVPGKLVGEYLTRERPLPGYGINLAGSLAGIAVFTLLSFFDLPPVLWVAIGLAAMLPFFYRDRAAIALFALTAIAIGGPGKGSYWSPYSHLILQPFTPPAGWSQPAAYNMGANHDYFQTFVDLSKRFVSRYPDVEPNHSLLETYEVPYRYVPHPSRVLVVGAGTGNDVAAALRHGAKYVDAVEIDPLILKIGRKYHPEHPYSSPAVHVHNTDARAFFQRAPKGSYDLVEFAYLDSHALFATLSSLRLDNYVYTIESLEEAKSLLKPGGTMVLAFAGGRSFVTDRIYTMLSQVFGRPPQSYDTRQIIGHVIFVEGPGEPGVGVASLPDIRVRKGAGQAALVATDSWPFLYLEDRSIPGSILVILLPFLLGAYILLRDTRSLPRVFTPWSQHLFLLGAGFLLLETTAVTRLSLLFGSTWIVNAVVIGAFLVMALAANGLVMLVPVSRKLAYGVLFASLAVTAFFPYSRLNALDTFWKVAVSGVVVGIPVFFSGMIFSRSFRDAANPSEALGVNLLGAVLGGALENTVTLGSTPLLGYLAIAIYWFSAAALLWHQRATRAEVPILATAKIAPERAI
jgi:SAM-dependent methyltransferase